MLVLLYGVHFRHRLLVSPSSHSSGEALLHLLPVDDLPDFFEELGSRILVVKVVSVLPHVHVEKWGVSSGADSVLVAGGQDLELLGLVAVTEPGPAGTLDSSSNTREFLLESLKITILSLDHIMKLTISWLTAVLFRAK